VCPDARFAIGCGGIKRRSRVRIPSSDRDALVTDSTRWRRGPPLTSRAPACFCTTAGDPCHRLLI